ncbi:conjugal transfer protein TraD [Burkholderia multivorans]|uniref:conjugal transfer protein TraD n=1 Tax=Burkholderia multivorans TaxID=87883 RepID=UPI0007579436|nr:conjugal transfer protein TraD [Burkholderia multivorans]KVS16155.1 hypothetical protein WK33_06380 [Burkholderia multivorans]MBU9651072.1 conjugal transfer protein TraD [Burkholderia multivorans]MCO1451078.1 conjugal transfer protein TraD [Burkholderia multivorans]MDN8103984.1 conjugal transfer protein TraD [Burkholderia multivorans]PRG70407.1 hypothetical protein C6T69_15155 [Burkholderia multivorans]
MTRPEWLAVRLRYIKGLAAPSEPQRLLVELAERPELDKSETKVLDQLMRLERINMKAEEAKADTEKLLRARRLEQEKARAKALAELGAVVDAVGFPLDPNILAGVLLDAIDRMTADAGLSEVWRKRGAERSAEGREDEKKAEAA